MKPVMNESSAVTIGVHYQKEGIEILGSPDILALMATKDTWFQPQPDDNMALFKQLFVKVQELYAFTPNQICFYAEGNFTKLGGKTLEPIVVELMNYTSPGFSILPTATNECCQFINYWRQFYSYPRFKLRQEFIIPKHFYHDLTKQKITDLNQLVLERRLTCKPPYIATFDKTVSAIVIQDIFIMMTIAINQSVNSLETLTEIVKAPDQMSGSNGEFSVDKIYNFFESKDSLAYRQKACFSTKGVVDLESTFLSESTEPMTPNELETEENSVNESSKDNKLIAGRLGKELERIQEIDPIQEDDSPKTIIQSHPQHFGSELLVDKYPLKSDNSYISTQSHLNQKNRSSTSFLSFFYCCCSEASVDVIPHEQSAQQKQKVENDLFTNTLS